MSETIVELTSIQQAFIYSMEYGMIIIGFVCMVRKTSKTCLYQTFESFDLDLDSINLILNLT